MTDNAPRATLYAFSYHGLTDATVMSIFREWQAWPRLDFHIKGGDANIDRARSRVASWFLDSSPETAGDVLLMADSDNAWQTGDLAMLARRAMEHTAVVGGIYPKRAFGKGVALWPESGAKLEYVLGEDELVPVRYVGTGMIAIPRVILERLSETLDWAEDEAGRFQPFFMPFLYDGLYPTDDAAFCRRVRDVGYPVYASTYPIVTHEGTYVYRVQDGYGKPPDTKPEYRLRLDGVPRLELVRAE